LTTAPVEISRRAATIGVSLAPDSASSGSLIYDIGGNFEVELERGIAICRIWARPDLDREEGARLALQNVEAFNRLASEPATLVRAVVLDLTRAPSMWGSITQSCLERMVAILESSRRPLAVLSQDAMQSQQMQRILRVYAPLHGRLFPSFGEACAWAQSRR
jgi:hypothetical protein